MIQGPRRNELVRCRLRPKDRDSKELRFETDDAAGDDDGEMIGSIEELVVMDQVAFVLRGKRELVFKKGSFFAEQRDQNKEYSRAYSLVAPTSLAPMVLLLSEKRDSSS